MQWSDADKGRDASALVGLEGNSASLQAPCQQLAFLGLHVRRLALVDVGHPLVDLFDEPVALADWESYYLPQTDGGAHERRVAGGDAAARGTAGDGAGRLLGMDDLGAQGQAHGLVGDGEDVLGHRGEILLRGRRLLRAPRRLPRDLEDLAHGIDRGGRQGNAVGLRPTIQIADNA